MFEFHLARFEMIFFFSKAYMAFRMHISSHLKDSNETWYMLLLLYRFHRIMLCVLTAGGTNSVCRQIRQQYSVSSAVISFMKNAYLEELVETRIYFLVGCYVRTVSVQIGDTGLE